LSDGNQKVKLKQYYRRTKSDKWRR